MPVKRKVWEALKKIEKKNNLEESLYCFIGPEGEIVISNPSALQVLSGNNELFKDIRNGYSGSEWTSIPIEKSQELIETLERLLTEK